MFDSIGYSVYLSTFEDVKERLAKLYTKGSSIFTSFHISEEMDDTYTERAETMCSYLTGIGYQIIADVSKKTLEQFECSSLAEFAERMGISVLRIDYGFTEGEITEAGKIYPIAVNASTISEDMAERIAKEVKTVYAMHNFYPRPETGLDHEFFHSMNQKLKRAGMKVIAFIPGDEPLRGPLYQSLPTLEEHRMVSPYACYVDMRSRYGVDGVFVGDGVIGETSLPMIRSYDENHVKSLPCVLTDEYQMLYDRSFTIRPDSPSWIKRISESREYSCFGTTIKPDNCVKRDRGSITIDNEKYLRYSGEIQIITEEKEADDKVNVIGNIEGDYHLMLKNIENGDKIQFVK